MIVNGRLGDGARINEVHLAAELGVSRTPLREALNRLSAEGALTSAPNFGYSVRPLAVDEFEQLYDIRPILDPEALRLAGIPSHGRLHRLRKLNRALAAERRPETVVDIDDEWHLELIAGCPNRVLVDFIVNIIRRTRRYELALMRETGYVRRASKQHDLILKALRERDLRAACSALKRNMQSGKAPILAWLGERSPGGRAR